MVLSLPHSRKCLGCWKVLFLQREGGHLCGRSEGVMVERDSHRSMWESVVLGDIFNGFFFGKGCASQQA